MAFAQLVAAVPFYGGLTLDELAGRGVRWPERRAARTATLPAATAPPRRPPAAPAAPAPAATSNGHLRLGTYRPIWASPDVEISPALKFLIPRQHAELSPADAERLGIAHGDTVRVAANGTAVEATAAVRTGVPAGTVFLADGLAEELGQRVHRLRRRGTQAVIAFGDAAYYEVWWLQIVKAIIIFAVVFAVLPLLTVYERKLLGRFQHRYGPNRVGPFGLMQPLAEIVKFATKEPSRPRTSVGYMFVMAPAIAILTAVAALAIIPFGGVQHIFGHAADGKVVVVYDSLVYSAFDQKRLAAKLVKAQVGRAIEILEMAC